MKSRFTGIFLLLSFNLLGQWIKTNGPEGISITSFQSHNNILFAGTEAKGVFKSLNNGVSWSSSNTSVTSNMHVRCMGSDGSYLYIGIHGDGVYRSGDNGTSWQAANTGIENYSISCLYFTDGYLFAGTIGDGLFRSADHGITWINVNQGVLNSSYIKSMVCQNTRLMVEADNYIFFTYDYGITWDVDQGITSFYTIDRFFHHGDTLLASAFQTMFRSTDGGVNWDGPFYMGQNMFGFDNIGSTIYAAHQNGVFQSTDWGQTWTTVPSTGLRWGERGDNAFIISGGRMLIGSDEIGIYSSIDNGASWTQCNLAEFPRGSTVDDAMIHYNGTTYAGTHSNGVYSTVDHGNTWTKIGTPNNLDTLSNCIIFSMLHPDANVILAGTCGNGLYRSADNGASWTRIYSGLPVEPGTNWTCIKSLGKSGSNIIAATTKGVFYSTDLGLNWIATNIVGSWVLETGGLAIRNNIVCTGVAGFPSIPYTGIYRSTDFGVTWTWVSGALDISFLGAGGNTTMYAGSLFNAYVSHDDGLTWAGIAGTGGVFAILAWDNFALIGNQNGILFTSNNGNSWIFRNEGLDPSPNHSVQGFAKDNVYVYAGTFRNAVWKRSITNLISGAGPLPVKLFDFKVEYRNGISHLGWKTLTETNADHFEIQRSFNGTDFYPIGTVSAHGNSTSVQAYVYDDLNPRTGINYYRLKMLDADGKFEYSNILSIRAGSDVQSVEVFPNPVSGRVINLRLNNLLRDNYVIGLYNAAGQSVLKAILFYTGGSLSQTLELPMGIPAGIYNIRVSSGTNKYEQLVVIK